MAPADSFEKASSQVPANVQSTVAAVVKADYADSYPASLFKNLGKCGKLAAHFE
jgi:hypothetical protein